MKVSIYQWSLAICLSLLFQLNVHADLPPALDPDYNPEQPVDEGTSSGQSQAPSAEQICNEILPNPELSKHHYNDVIQIQCESWKDNQKYVKAQKEMQTIFFIAGGVCLFECVKDVAKGMACAGATGFAFTMDQQKAKDLKRSNHDTQGIGVETEDEDQAFLNQLHFEMQLAKQIQEKGMKAFPVTTQTLSYLKGKTGGNWGITPEFKVSKRLVSNEIKINQSTLSAGRLVNQIPAGANASHYRAQYETC